MKLNLNLVLTQIDLISLLGMVLLTMVQDLRNLKDY
jgi:hypothetical protein